MHSFIIACGVTLLIIYFSGRMDWSNEFIRDIVVSVFVASLAIQLILRLMTGADVQPMKCSVIGKAKISTFEQRESINDHIIVHEAGHALMAYIVGIDNFSVQVSDTDNRLTYFQRIISEQNIKNKVLIDYAGAVSEEMILGEFHGGCCIGPNNDFAQATECIKGYVLMTNRSKSMVFLESELSKDVVEVSKAFYAEAKEIILNHKCELDVLIKALRDEKYLTKKNVTELLSPCGIEDTV